VSPCPRVWKGWRLQRVYWIHVLLFVREPYSMMICTANIMSQSSLAPSAMLVSAQGGALANEAALLFNPTLAPSHLQHQSQSLANSAPPQSEAESLPLQGSSHL
jgi:hypothetical protein